MEGSHTLVRVISGGQVGADQAALRAARYLGLETGGVASKGYRTSAGSQRELLASYGLAEGAGTGTASYVVHSKRNVDDTQATLAFRMRSSAGTDRIIGYCITGSWERGTTLAMGASVDAMAYVAPGCHRPVLVVQHMTLGAQEAVRIFLRTHGVRVLNVAGHRKVDGEPGWEDAVEQFLIKALAR